MAYKLELKGYVHLEALSSTLQRWSNAQPDVFIISQEGDKIYAQGEEKSLGGGGDFHARRAK